MYGIVLEAETGEAIEGVYVDLINAQTKESIQKVETNSYGYYEFQNVVSKEHVLRVTLENYSTIERTFAPDSATQAPFTLSKGNELLEEDLTLSTSGWSLQNAVALSTGIALVTILAGIIGLNGLSMQGEPPIIVVHNISQDLRCLVVVSSSLGHSSFSAEWDC